MTSRGAPIEDGDIRDILEQAPCGVLAMLPDATIVLVNRTLEEWTGRTRDELLGSPFHDLLTAAGRIFYENQYAPLLHMQGSVKEVAFELVRAGSQPLPVLVSSRIRAASHGRPELIVSAIFEASDRRRYERELLLGRRRAEQLAAVVEASGDAILLVAPDGTVRTWNPGAAALFGYAPEDVIGRPGGLILPVLDEPDERAGVLSEIRGGRAVHFEGEGVHADGRRIPVSVALAPHMGSLGELDAVSLIVRDTSARRAIERLQQEFLAMVSHELRNPLGAISGYAQLLLRRGIYDEPAIRTIQRQVVVLDRLIDDLLLASSIETHHLALRISELDLVVELRAAIDAYRAEGRAISLEAPTAPIMVHADQQRLAQVWSNLLSNAMKYSRPDTPIRVSVTTDADSVHVAIADEGEGIPADALPHLFDRFFRARTGAADPRGLGLGLYITRGLVDAHGGSITAESERGRGTTFTVALPLTRTGAAKQHAPTRGG